MITEEETIPDKERTSRKGSTIGSDKQLHKMVIVPGMEVLLLNPRHIFCPGNLISNWSGPFKVIKVCPYGGVELEGAGRQRFQVKGHQMKPYFGGEPMETNTTLLQEPSL